MAKSIFVKMYAAYSILSQDATVQSWEQKPSSIVEITSIEELISHFENAKSYHEVIFRGKKMTASEVAAKGGFIYNFFQNK